MLNRIQQKLKCGHPLLTVNHFPPLYIFCRSIHLLEDNRAKKVTWRMLLSLNPVIIPKVQLFKIILGRIAHVIPERFPLLILIPYVGSLELRNRVSNVFLE